MNIVAISILVTIGLSALGVLGDFFIKLAGNGSKYIEFKWFIAGLLVYAGTAFGWFFVMKHLKLATLGIFYTVSTVLCITLLGLFYFKESINGYEILGISMAICSLVLLGKFA